MLNLHTGNRLEDLADALFHDQKNEQRSPFEPLTLVCESHALATWLKRRFSLEQGIACLIQTPLPAAWLWQTLRRLLDLPPADDPLDRERLPWRLLPLLHPDRLREPVFDELATYLRDDDNGLKRWQLARRIADAFDRYQYHRPELIREWSAGGGQGWDARLWHAVVEGVDTHRVALIDEFLDRLRDGDIDGLPARVDLFSLHNLPPLLMEAYAAMARHTAVHLWQLSPTEQYWADLATPRELAEKRREDPDNLALWQQGNPLLTQWGREARSFQDVLLRDDLELEQVSEHFRPPQRDSLLHHLQADVYEAVDETADTPTVVTDESPLPSIQFHVCHSPLRECQALHDTLLHCLQADETLQPEDILVMVPEIARYAPAIEAVFGGIRDNTRLPFHVADVLHADEHPLIRAFLDLLELPDRRFTRAEVLGLADLPQVRRRFGLDEADVADLADLFDTLKVYWGLDGEHRQALGLPALDDNTWQQAKQRIMAGLALGDVELYRHEDHAIAPANRIGAHDGERAARFFDLLDTLRHWAAHLASEATPREWSHQLGRMLDDLFADNGDDTDRLRRIREALAELARIDELEVGPVTRTMVREYLVSCTSGERVRGRLYREGITFCAMRPLRGVPFRVIALLGMQDTAFPRRGRHAEFDRMARRRHGDPDPAQEDRYLFLETLLAARERLIISYTGRNARNNDPLEPSVVVRELMDYLDERYRFETHPDLPLSRALTRVHALHPFSPRNFGGTGDEDDENRDSLLLPTPISHDRRWFEAARAIAGHHPPKRERGWPLAAIPRPEEHAREVTPDELARFLRDPVKQFVQQRLRVYEPGDPALAEDEPFNLGNLQQWNVRNLWLQSWQRGESRETARRLAHARGLLPHGPWGERVLAEVEADVDAIATRCAERGITPPISWRPVDIDLPMISGGERWHVSGRIPNVLAKQGLVLLSASNYGMSKLLALWVQHLCLQTAGLCAGQAALAFFKDRSVVIQPLAPEEAETELARILDIYHQGLMSPLPLPRDTFDAFAAKLEAAETPDEQQALAAANDKWNAKFREPDRKKFFNRLVLHGHDWEPDEELAETAMRLIEPLRARMTLEK